MAVAALIAAATAARVAVYSNLPLPTDPAAVGFISNATFALLAVRYANQILNSWALNHWHTAATSRWSWSEEIAVITGGCGGIGRELVLGLVKKGVKVAVFDIIPLPEDLSTKPNVIYLETDITSEKSIAESAAAEFLPSMILQNKGHVVNISSVTAYMALPSMVDYCASKAASVTFHEGLNCELKTKYKATSIITTIVQPSWVRTPMSPKNVDEIEKAQGKMLAPQEVANRTLEQVFSGKGVN